MTTSDHDATEVEANLEQVIADLKARKKSIRCEELRSILEEWGFEVRNGKKGNHRIATHDGLKDFYSIPYNCGHGRDSEIKHNYISNVVKVLENHRVELINFRLSRS